MRLKLSERQKTKSHFICLEIKLTHFCKKKSSNKAEEEKEGEEIFVIQEKGIVAILCTQKMPIQTLQQFKHRETRAGCTSK